MKGIEDCETVHTVDGAVEYDYIPFENSGSLMITKCFVPPYVQRLLIPHWLDDRIVEGVYHGTFSGCCHLWSVHFESDLQMVGNPFYGMRSLYELEVVGERGRLEMVDDMLIDSIQKRVVCMPSGAFAAQKTEVVIPEGIRHIGAYAFFENQQLKKVGLPDSVARIGKCAFEGCTHLKEIRIPKNVVAIDADAFARCEDLKEANRVRLS